AGSDRHPRVGVLQEAAAGPRGVSLRAGGAEGAAQSGVSVPPRPGIRAVRRHTEGPPRAGGSAASESHLRRGRRGAPGARVAQGIAGAMPITRDRPLPASLTTADPNVWRRPLLLIVAIELILLFAPTVRFLVDRWTVSVWHNAHGMFVPPLVAWFAWQELKTRTA